MRVVFGEVLHALLDLLGIGLETRYLPLLFLNTADGLKNYFDDPIILLFMILVEPQVVYHHEDPLAAPPSHHVEEGPNGKEDAQGSHTLALPIFVHLVEGSAFHAVVSSSVAGLALSGTVLPADVFLKELVLDAVADLIFALPNFKLIALYAGRAVVGEETGSAFLWASIVGMD